MSSRLRFIANSIEEEKIICDNTLENVGFYKEYKLVFTLPQKTIEEEYDPKRYSEFMTFLERWWTEEDEAFIDKLLLFFNKDKDTIFTIKVSNYGVLGSYSDKENIVILNCCIKDIDFDPIRIVKHEIIHILVEPFIREYSIVHEKKEEIVNGVLKLMRD